jgi:hypothetical protein
VKRSTAPERDAPEPLPPTGHAYGSFAETREWRLDLTLAATPAARLRWLEEAIRLATRSGALPKPR